MKVLTLLSQKGGVGKTTLAIHLAGCALKHGLKTALIDTDPQRSLHAWWQQRTNPSPLLIERKPTHLRPVLQSAKDDGYELILIDTPPHEKEASLVLPFASFVLIPTRPALFDLKAIGVSVDRVRALNQPAAIVLNVCPPPRQGTHTSSLVREARQGLLDYQIPVCPVALSQRVSLAHALLDGRTLLEFEPNGKAAHELTQLWNWLDNHMPEKETL